MTGRVRQGVSYEHSMVPITETMGHVRVLMSRLLVVGDQGDAKRVRQLLS